jgi:hypothetical protein
VILSINSFYLFSVNFRLDFLVPGAFTAILKSIACSLAMILGEIETVLSMKGQEGRAFAFYPLRTDPVFPAILLFHAPSMRALVFNRDNTQCF